MSICVQLNYYFNIQNKLMQIRINPAKAYLTNKMDVFSENDPFIMFQMGSQKQRTKTQIDKKSPEWDQQFVFKPEGDNILRVIAMDEDELLHEEIGTALVNLNPYFQSNQYAQKFISLRTKEKQPAGKILLRIMPMNYVNNPNERIKKTRSNDEMKWYVPPSQRRAMLQNPNMQYQQGISNMGNNMGINNYPQNQFSQPTQIQYNNGVPIQPSQNINGQSNYSQQYMIPQRGQYNNMQYTTPNNQQNYYQQRYTVEQPYGQGGQYNQAYQDPRTSGRQSGGFRQKIHNKIEGVQERIGQKMGKEINSRDLNRAVVYRYD